MALQKNKTKYNPLVELTTARIKQFGREPEAVFWVFIFPVLLSLALGIAFRYQPAEKVRVALVDDSGNSGETVILLRSDPDLDVELLEREEALRRLRIGKVDIIVHRRTGYFGPKRAAAEAADTARYELEFDPARPQAKLALVLTKSALGAADGPATNAKTDRIVEKHFDQPGGRYIDFLIPGLIGLNLMSSGLWGIGFVVVEQRTRKLLKRFVASPMRRSHYLLSFIFSRLAFLFVEIIALVGFARLVFGVRIYGSSPALLLVILLGSMTFSGMGMLVAARPKTIEGVSGLINLVMMPMWVFSGSFFSYERFPEFIHPAIRLLPLTALNDAARAIMSEGRGLFDVGSEMAVLAGWCVISFAVAVKIFRWQ